LASFRCWILPSNAVFVGCRKSSSLRWCSLSGHHPTETRTSGYAHPWWCRPITANEDWSIGEVLHGTQATDFWRRRQQWHHLETSKGASPYTSSDGWDTSTLN
jgi:hypothetical protein